MNSNVYFISYSAACITAFSMRSSHKAQNPSPDESRDRLLGVPKCYLLASICRCQVLCDMVPTLQDVW